MVVALSTIYGDFFLNRIRAVPGEGTFPALVLGVVEFGQTILLVIVRAGLYYIGANLDTFCFGTLFGYSLTLAKYVEKTALSTSSCIQSSLLTAFTHYIFHRYNELD